MSQSQPTEITWSNLGPELLERAPRYLIYFLLFYAPFCYGLRNGVGESFFVSVAFVAFFLHCWKCYLDDRWPRVPAWLLFCMSLIALQGLWMCLNADSYHRWHRELITVRFFLEPPPFPSLPGSRDLFASPVQFIPQLAVMCLLLVICDWPDNRRLRLLVLCSICASLLAMVGIAMKVGGKGAIEIYWKFTHPNWYKTVFASYRYHGNAATFLIIGLCVNLGIIQYSLPRPPRLIHLVGTAGALLTVGGLAMNTSRAGWLLTIVVAAMFAPSIVRRYWTIAIEREGHSKTIWSGLIVGIAVTITILAVFGSDLKVRSSELSNLGDAFLNRIPVTLFTQMAAETPAMGFGPGTFAYVFPKYQLANPGVFPSRWFLNEAHQDFFQLFSDWGPWTFVCWLVILIGPVAGFAMSRRVQESNRLKFGCFAACVATLIHAMADFPLQVTSLLFYYAIMLAMLIKPAARALSAKRN